MGNVLLCTATRLLGLVEDAFRSLLAARQRNDEARQRSEELRQTQFEQREQQQHEESRRQSAHLNKMVDSLQETVVLQNGAIRRMQQLAEQSGKLLFILCHSISSHKQNV